MESSLVRIRAALFVTIVTLLVGTASSVGTQPTASRQVAASRLTPEQALPLTCVQAWAAAGKRYPEMVAIVRTLAKVSLANRSLTLPNTREAGVDAGRGIAQECKADPDALLFAVVDKEVRRVATQSRQ